MRVDTKLLLIAAICGFVLPGFATDNCDPSVDICLKVVAGPKVKALTPVVFSAFTYIKNQGAGGKPVVSVLMPNATVFTAPAVPVHNQDSIFGLGSYVSGGVYPGCVFPKYPQSFPSKPLAGIYWQEWSSYVFDYYNRFNVAGNYTMTVNKTATGYACTMS